MPKTKKSRKPSVRVADLSAKQNPKGGATDIVITKVVDKASTTLLQSCATGEHVIK